MAKLECDHEAAGDIHHAQECEPGSIERPAHFDKRGGSLQESPFESELHREQSEARQIDQERGAAAANPLLRFGKHEAEMQEQSGRQEPRHHVADVNDLVEIIQLAGVVEGGEDKARKAEHVEMQRARGVAAAKIDEQADRDIDHGDGVLIVDRRIAIGFAGDDLDVERLTAITADQVLGVAPGTQGRQSLGRFDGAADAEALDRNQDSRPRGDLCSLRDCWERRRRPRRSGLRQSR